MRNLLVFILALLIFGTFTFSCSRVYAANEAYKHTDGVCYIGIYEHGTISTGNFWNRIWGWNTSIPRYEHQSNNGVSYGVPGYSYHKVYMWRWQTNTGTPYWEYRGSTDENGTVSSEEGIKSDPYVYSKHDGYGHDPNNWWPEGPGDLANCKDLDVNCSEITGDVEQLLIIDGTVSYDTALCMDGCELEPNGVSSSVRRQDCDNDGTADDPCSLFINYRYTGDTCPEGDPEAEDDPGCDYWEQVCTELCVGGDMNFACTEGGEVDCGCMLPEYPLTDTPTGFKPDQDNDGLPTGDPSETDADNDGDPDTTDPDPDGDDITSNDGDPDGDGEDNRGRYTFQNDPNWTDTHNGYGTDSDGDNDGDGQSNCTDDDIDGDGIPNDQDPDMDGDGVNNTSDVDADGCDGVDGAGEAEEGDNAGEADTDGDGDVDAEDPPAATEEWPTEEEIVQGYGEVTDNTYDGNVEGDFTDPDFDTTVQGYIDGNPFKSAIENSEINLTGSDACFRFPNPYEGGTEVYCIDTYESYFNAMGLILLGLTGFMCFRIIKG
jgi:hypothetical protein